MRITKKQLLKIIREEYSTTKTNRNRKSKSVTKNEIRSMIQEEKLKLKLKKMIREDAIDTELDRLHKNIGDDIEHIRDLKDDIKSDHEEEKRAEEAEDRKDEAFKRRLRRIVREEYGGGAHEYKRDDGHRTGDVDGHYKDFEGPEGGNAGDDSKTHPGHKDYEGDDSVEGKAHKALAAVHDLADAAGVVLDTTVSSPGESVDGLAMENRRRLKRNLRKTLRKTLGK